MGSFRFWIASSEFIISPGSIGLSRTRDKEEIFKILSCKDRERILASIKRMVWYMWTRAKKKDPGFILEDSVSGSNDLHQSGDYFWRRLKMGAIFFVVRQEFAFLWGVQFLFISFLNLLQVGAQTWRWRRDEEMFEGSKVLPRWKIRRYFWFMAYRRTYKIKEVLQFSIYAILNIFSFSRIMQSFVKYLNNLYNISHEVKLRRN